MKEHGDTARESRCSIVTSAKPSSMLKGSIMDEYVIRMKCDMNTCVAAFDRESEYFQNRICGIFGEDIPEFNVSQNIEEFGIDAYIPAELVESSPVLIEEIDEFRICMIPHIITYWKQIRPTDEEMAEEG